MIGMTEHRERTLVLVASPPAGRARARPRHFVHAAALGLNVAFARVATRASVRKRLGRLTYMVAASALIRRREAFRCVLSLDDGARPLPLSLVHLSVMNAPVFG